MLVRRLLSFCFLGTGKNRETSGVEYRSWIQVGVRVEALFPFSNHLPWVPNIIDTWRGHREYRLYVCENPSRGRCFLPLQTGALKQRQFWDHRSGTMLMFLSEWLSPFLVIFTLRWESPFLPKKKLISPPKKKWCLEDTIMSHTSFCIQIIPFQMAFKFIFWGGTTGTFTFSHSKPPESPRWKHQTTRLQIAVPDRQDRW